MTTAVCVPYRGDDGGHRDRSWTYVRSWWQQQQLGPVFTGDTPGSFNRAGARNAAARAAGSWDVAIFGDADTIMVDPQPVHDAVTMARECGCVVLPHTRYVALTVRGTVLALRGSSWHGETKQEKATVPLGIVVVSRQAFDTIGGFDERFTGWGGEDVAFRLAADTLTGLQRLPGTLLHLWHPRDPTKADYIASRGGWLRQAYREADGDQAAMRKLLEGT